MKIKFFKSVGNIVPILSSLSICDEQCFVVSYKKLLIALKCLKLHKNYQYNLLTCISGVDLLHSRYRFGVIYDLLSINSNSRVRVKVFINETTSIDSIVDIFYNANWWEREVWDMYGIYFNKHPDLRRILTDYGFEGYPMRKDFPLSGYVELRYSQKKKRIVVEPLELTQDFRYFNFETPW